jgi:UDP-N-acetylmuramoyl-tripeptide--D-alanyl-D-alanine ligase
MKNNRFHHVFGGTFFFNLFLYQILISMAPVHYLLQLVNQGHTVSTDTRTLMAGQIFFALKGGNFNGNKYADQAIGKGAFIAVVDEKIDLVEQNREKYLLVDDVLSTLQALARKYRQQFDIPVFGITGSNGKTTTKELLHKVLSQKYSVVSTKGNLNNYIGVPLTLLNIVPGSEFAIIEMGASEPGEIAGLCAIALPTAGIVTNVGTAHIEGFGSEKVVWETKSGLYRFLEPNDGTLFIPLAYRNHANFNPSDFLNALYFEGNNIDGKDIVNVELTAHFPFVAIALKTRKDERIHIQSNLFGKYNFENLVNVIKIADYYDLTAEQIKEGIEKYQPANNRSQLVRDVKGNTIIMDAYNANPSSVASALDHFTALESKENRIAILGDMLELGEVEAKEHERVVERLKDFPNILCVFVGVAFSRALKSSVSKPEHFLFFENTGQATAWWRGQDLRNQLILVKGSRGLALEKLFE